MRWTDGLLVVALAGAAVACGSGDGASTAAEGACPGGSVDIVVSVDQWAYLVGELAGPCGDVTTIVSGSSVDPHDYELAPADAAAFDGAELVVINGADYDHWAEDAVDAAGGDPVVVDAAEVVGAAEGDNPHLWYSPAAVSLVTDAVGAQLLALRPAAAAELQEQRALFDEGRRAYDHEVAAARAAATERTYAATEAVFDPMAATLGLVDVTPAGYRKAAANESEPGPADIAAFEQLLRDGEADVLIFNIQTEGAVPDQLRDRAEAAGVPVVEVTETVAPGAEGFFAWQAAQLRLLRSALGGA